MAGDAGFSLFSFDFNFGGGGGDADNFNRLGNVVWSAVSGADTHIIDSLNQTLATNRFWTDVMGNNILRHITETEGRLTQQYNDTVDSVTTLINAMARTTTQPSVFSDASILAAISKSHIGVVDAVEKSTAAILGKIAADELGVTGIFRDVNHKLDDILSSVHGAIDGVIGELKRSVEYTINNTVHIDSSVFDGMLNNVRGVLADQATVMEGVVNVFDHTINGTFAAALDKQYTPLAFEAVNSGRSAAALETLAKIGIDDTTHNDNRPWQDSWFELFDKIRGKGGEVVDDLAERLRSYIVRVIMDGENVNLDADDCLIPLLRRTNGNDSGWWIVNLLTLTFSAGVLPFSMAAIQANRKVQNFRTCFPDQVLSPPYLEALHYKLGYDTRDLLPYWQRQGYSKADAELVMRTWVEVPDVTVLIAMYYRGLIGENELKQKIGQHGFDRQTQDNILKLSQYLPPVQDLITMSVRDVFDSATTTAYRQYEDYPPDFTKYMSQQGVSEYWAKQYWAAHWRLPSETMGFEMFHRGIITEAEMKNLMKSLDIMPGWRDKLVQLSYNPLTRVDVRRMYNEGVLNEEEVNRAYLDIGYSPANAQRLTAFTKKLKKVDSLATLDVASDLTKGNIVGFYTDHVISRTVAQGLLLQAGVNAVAGELLLQSADFDIERRERAQLKTLIIERYKTGRYTFEQAVAESRKSGFTDRETEQVILDLELIQAKEYKLPSRADLDKFIKKGIIDEATYKTTMVQLGYSDYWAERYLEAI